MKKVSARRGWQAGLLALVPAWFAAIWVEQHGLGVFFTSDDLVALARVAGLEATPPMFRPLSANLAMRLQYVAFGLNPTGYHVVNMGLHLLSAAGTCLLALRLGMERSIAAAAAVLFAASGIAFTPLHAVSGIGDLLACTLLLTATLLHVEGRRRGSLGLVWVAATVASAAVLSKENAVAWPLVVAVLEWRTRFGRWSWPFILPSLVSGVAMAIWLMVGQLPHSDAAGPYGLDFSLVHLATNLATYARWSLAFGTPMRDLVASPDPTSLPIGVAATLAIWLIHRLNASARPLIEVGSAWWLAFLLPVLPLARHSYLYYLYVPWAGGAIALAAACAALLATVFHGGRSRVSNERWGRWQSAAAIVAVAIFVLMEQGGVATRERSLLDALPADRTLREAALLGHALPALQRAALPEGTPIGFVNPVPRAAAALPSNVTANDQVQHNEYVPLEVALRGGRALKLFAPGLVDSGFAVSIPPDWDRIECFLYEQRGWLRHWGHGQDALMRQAELQAAMGRWAAAESSFVRVRSLGDTLPAALCGQAVALSRLGRLREARALTDTFARRFPGDSREQLLRTLPLSGPPDPRLVRPFNQQLPVDPANATTSRPRR